MPTLYNRIDHALETGASNETLLEFIAPSLARIAIGDFGKDFDAISHPLGFDTLHLERDGNQAVCIHDWCGCFNEPTPNVVGTEHDHSWDMKSRVLAGSITDTQLQVVTGSHIPNATHFVFDTQTNGLEDTLKFLNEWGVISDSKSRLYGVEETYGFGKGKPHSSDASSDLVTLVLAHNYPGTQNRSFSPIHTPDKLVPFPYKKYSILRSPLSRNQTRLLAEHIMEALGIQMPSGLAHHPARLSLETREALPNTHVPGRQVHRRKSNARLWLPKGNLTE